MISYPDPTPADLERSEFKAVWQAIKSWDISRSYGSEGYAGATGNDVMHILNSITNLRYGVDQATIDSIVKEHLPIECQSLSENIADSILQELVFRRIESL